MGEEIRRSPTGGPMTVYALGYYAALWSIPRWCNPFLWPPARLAWALGHDDAVTDARPCVRPRLQAEFERR